MLAKWENGDRRDEKSLTEFTIHLHAKTVAEFQVVYFFFWSKSICVFDIQIDRFYELEKFIQHSPKKKK